MLDTEDETGKLPANGWDIFDQDTDRAAMCVEDRHIGIQ